MCNLLNSAFTPTKSDVPEKSNMSQHVEQSSIDVAQDHTNAAKRDDRMLPCADGKV